MSWFAWSLVIFLTALVAILGTAVLIGRQPRVPLDRLADPRPLPGELPIAGYFDLPDTLARFTAPGGPYGPFPVDTGPLLHLSETTAANAELDRWTQARIAETDWLVAEAEAKIPPRWR